MTVKRKIIISVLISFCIPFGLTLIIATSQLSGIKDMLSKDYAYPVKQREIINKPHLIYNEIAQRNHKTVMDVVQTNPEKMTDMKYLDTVNNDISKTQAFIYVKTADGNKYSGQNIDKNDELIQAITDGKTYYISSKCLYESTTFVFESNELTLYTITDIFKVQKAREKLLRTTVITFVLSSLIAALLLSVWLYLSFYRQVNLLTAIAKQISESELDKPINVAASTDEIMILCSKLEETRKKLLAMVEDRLQYEEDTREMITSLAHDFRTPLTAIKGYAEGIMDGVANTEEKRNQYLRTIYTKANDLSFLVDELSLFTKIEGNNLIYNFKALNLNDYFSDCLEEIALDMDSVNFKLTFENEVNKNAVILADPEQLKRVIVNITGNSVKYNNKDGGNIDVHISELSTIPTLYRVLGENNKPLDKFVLVSLRDDGPGVPEKVLPLIFNRFYRTDASRNSAKPGSGLGLSIVAKIIDDHGGKIWAENASPHGLNIYFTLKLKN